ncbi:MAG: competence/damage-inducible protein A [Bdellovibrionales bacterium]|nr:competence/damage-inducible protein A [Bdellovibrionales bacterium]
MSGNLMVMKSAIINVGSELTSGEIINRNAADLAQKLQKLNIETSLQLVVPDNKELILKACYFAQENADILFFTGGLGPTSDDFTREVIAEWAQQELEFRSEVYTELAAKFKAMNRELKESHKQQCFFPKNSKTFPNNAGHALAFQLMVNNKLVYVLPGPPQEIASIWQDSIYSELKDLQIEPQDYFYYWKCFGKGESDFAELTEEIFKESGFLLGYRATIPYVFVKVWVPKEKLPQKDVYFSRFEQEFAAYIVKKDFYETLAKLLNSYDQVYIFDGATQLKVLKRLLDLKIPELERKIKFQNYAQRDGWEKDLKLQLMLEVCDDYHWQVSCEYADQKFSQNIPMAYNMKVYSERSQLYIVEKAAEVWLQFLQQLRSSS